MPIDPADAYTILEPRLNNDGYSEVDIDARLPVYSSKDVYVSEAFVHGGSMSVSRVRLVVTNYFARPMAEV